MAHDHTVLVLQGGGALGAYQAGVYEGMAEHGLAPDWVTGVSIGAINGSRPMPRRQRSASTTPRATEVDYGVRVVDLSRPH